MRDPEDVPLAERLPTGQKKRGGPKAVTGDWLFQSESQTPAPSLLSGTARPKYKEALASSSARPGSELQKREHYDGRDQGRDRNRGNAGRTDLPPASGD